MKRKLVFLALLTFSLTGVSPARAADDDAKLIIGTWVYHKLEVNGKEEVPKEKPSLEITADKLLPVNKNDPASYKLDKVGELKTIDITPLSGGGTEQILKGVYKLDGDFLTLCFARDRVADRPKDLVPKEGNMVITLKREKK